MIATTTPTGPENFIGKVAGKAATRMLSCLMLSALCWALPQQLNANGPVRTGYTEREFLTALACGNVNVPAGNSMATPIFVYLGASGTVNLPGIFTPPFLGANDQLGVTTSTAGNSLFYYTGSTVPNTATGLGTGAVGAGNFTFNCAMVNTTFALYVNSALTAAESAGCNVAPVYVMVKDNLAPIITTCPPNVTVDCNTMIPAPAMSLAGFNAAGGVASDNCSITTVSYADVNTPGACANKHVIARTWTLSDISGNATTCTQSISISDNDAPVFSGSAGGIVINCNATVADQQALINAWLGNNTDPVANPNNLAVMAGYISGDGTLNAADVCTGNTVTINATPATGAAVLALMPAACSPTPRIIFVVFQASDGCGNTIDVQGTVELRDITPPTASNPAVMNLTCDVLPAPDPAVVTTETDDCTPVGSLSVTHVSTTAVALTGTGCPPPVGTGTKVYNRVYRVTDCSNNTVDVTQTINVLDDVVPTWTTDPTNLTFACDAAGIATTISNWLNTPNGPIVGGTGLAQDNCGGAVSYTATLPGPVTATAASIQAALDAAACVGGLRTVTVTFTPTDGCGNVGATRNATVTRTDLIAPTASNPSPVSITCAAQLPAPDPLVVTDESDNCTPAVSLVVANGVTTNNGGTGCPGSPLVYSRTYTVTDQCGNTTTVTQTITQLDNIAPVFTVSPVDITVDGCAETASTTPALATWYTENTTDGAPLADGDDPNGAAACADPTVTIVANKTLNQIEADLIAALCDQTTHIRTTTVTFRVVDDCGNQSTPVTVNVSIRDMVAPTATNPAAIAIQCDENIPLADPLVVTDEADNCTGALSVVLNATNVIVAAVPPCGNQQFNRVYRVTDVCGNTVDVTQSVTVNDNIIPTANCTSSTQQLGANGTVAVPATAFNNGSLDNCDGTLTMEYRIPSIPAFSTFQTSHTLDCSVIPNITGCNDAPANSADVAIEFRVRDVCGNNSLNCSGPGAFVRLQDLIAPTIGTAAAPCPANLTVNTSVGGTGDCTASATWTHPIPTDNCSIFCMTMEIAKEINGVFVIQSTTTIAPGSYGGAAGPFNFLKGPLCTDDDYRITYNAKDEHGNTATACSFVVKVVDNEPPTVSCNGAAGTVNLTAVLGDCYQTYSWIRPTGTDNCQPPLGPCPAPVVSIESILPAANNVIVNSIGTSDIATFPVGTTTITYAVTDAQGNITRCTLTVNVADTQAPMAMCVGAFTVNLDPNGTKTICFDEIGGASTDNCGLCSKEISLNGSPFASCVTLTCANLGANTITVRVRDCSAPTPNEHTCTTTVTVTDAQTPGFAFCPADYIETTGAGATCDTTFAVAQPTVYANGCGTTTNATFVSAIYTDGTRQAIGSAVTFDPVTRIGTFPAGTTTITYQYTYTGAGGVLHTITCQFNVIVSDNDRPTIVCPVNVTGLDCQTPTPAPLTIAAFTGGTLTDNCGVTQLIHSDVDNMLTACPSDGIKMTTRTYTAFDAAGNSNTCVMTFTWLEDNVAPTFSGTAADATGVCATDVPAVTAVTAIDNTGGCAGVTIDYESVITNLAGTGAPLCANKFLITRTWVATDACGNSATTTQLVTINDTTNPTLIGLPAATVTEQCISAVPAPPVVTASDNCTTGASVVLSETEDPGASSCLNNTVITRTWTATDVCFNTTVFTQTITVNDNTAPALASKPADIPDLTCASQVTAMPTITATDNCGIVFVEANEVLVPGNCSNRFSLIRTWRATDACGNFDVHTQTITVNDQTAPGFTGVPADANVTCAALVPAVVHPTASDNCGIVSVDFAEYDIPGACPDRFTRIRRWVATDECGLSTTTSQTIVVNDLTAPVLSSLPANDAVACAQLVPAAAVLTASDNCQGPVPVVYTAVINVGDCPNRYTITRTWQASDLCGQTTVHTQIITVNDLQAPTWIEPAPATPLTFQCAEDVPAVPVQTATDNCGVPVIIDFSEVTDPGTCPNDFIITRTWRAQDDCGNSTIRQQVINVFDNVKPTLLLAGVPVTNVNLPAVGVACSNFVPAAAVLTATDNCDNQVNVLYTEELFPGTCANMFSIRRTWSVEDLCANQSTFLQIITVNDLQAPTWDQAAPTTPVNVQCADQVPAIPVQTVTDNCGVPIDVDYYETTVYGNCVNNFTLTRTWTATDDCGNSTRRIQVINVNDTTNPTLLLNGAPVDPAQLPPTLTFECADQVPGPPTLTASDNCDASLFVDYTEYIQQMSCVNQLIVNRKWTVYDMCGNSATYTQVITVNDNKRPILFQGPNQMTNPDGSRTAFANAQLPATLVFQCFDQVPGPPTLTATDNCDASIFVDYTEYIQDGACINDFVINRKWTAYDMCGNSVTLTQTVTVLDNTKPILYQGGNAVTDALGNPTAFGLAQIPPTLTFSCSSQVPGPPTLTASDNCDAFVNVIYSEYVQYPPSGGCVNRYTVNRKWTAVDMCGNSVTYTQVITVNDITAPTLINAPSGAALNLAFSCSENLPIAPVVTATDNCDAAVNVIYSEELQPGTCANRFTMKRTWTAEDICGNKTVVTQTIVINDITAPTLIGLPTQASLSFACADQIPAVPVVTATDNCNVPVVVQFVEVEAPGNCVNHRTVTRTWSAMDDCGNSTSFVQTITVNDNIAPTLINAPSGAALNLAFSCSQDLPPAAVVTATDNCDAAVNVIYSEELDPGTCANSFTMRRTWTAEDICGNKTVVTQTIVINDITAPVLIGLPTPAVLNLTCASSLPAAPVVTATDNCGVPIVVQFTEVEVPGICLNKMTYVRTWSAMDDCGNSTSFVQTININDNVAPTILVDPNQVPPILVYQCADQVPGPPNLLATDNCDGPIDVVYEEYVQGQTCVNNFIVNRKWTAVDACGNTSTYTQVITVNDNIAPTLLFSNGTPVTAQQLPPTLVFQCSAQVPGPPTLIASDNCDASVNVIYSENIQNQTCTNHFIINRKWTAVDMCGNITTWTQVVTVNDTQAPVLTGVPTPAVLDLTCAQDVPATPVVTAADNCDSPIDVIYTEELLPGTCANRFTIKRKWYAEDLCGNSVVATQTINVNDVTPPVWQQAAPDAVVNLQCASAVPVAPVQTATDNCGIPIDVDFVEIDQPGTCVNKFTKTRIWTATDDCGNSTQRVQVINVNDNIAPTLIGTPVATVNGSCSQDVPVAAVVTATDNCDPAVNVIYSEELQPGTCANRFTIKRTWTAEDICGNKSVFTQTITINDVTAPTLIGLPANAAISLSCAAGIPAPPVVTATDNCGVPIVVQFTEVEAPGTCVNKTVFTRTWSAMDDCGNATSFVQVITVNDNVAPTLIGTPVATVNGSCSQDVPVAAVVTATDNCDPAVNVIYSEELQPGTCSNRFTIKRTWTAEDICGNKSVFTQTITINDVTAPTLQGLPAATVSLSCAAGIPAPPVVTATDNCGVPIVVQFTEVEAPGTCVNKTVFTRTWSAMDDCGNATSFVQVITVNDNVAPTLIGTPAATVTASCSQDVPVAAVVTATDNCDPAVNVIYSEELQPGTCSNQFSIKRTWTAEDICGNKSVFTQTVTINDSQAPTLIGLPAATITASCAAAIPAPPVVTATDNCGVLIVVDLSEVEAPGTCVNKTTFTRTWTATDDCGNATSFVQTITVNDNIAPTLINAPAQTVVNVTCAQNVPNAPDVSATDNCDPAVNVIYSEELQPGTCSNKFTIKRTWTAEDICGNKTTATQTINVDDTVAPVFSSTPTPVVNVTCAGDVPASPVLTATDNCGVPVVVTFMEFTAAGSCDHKFTVTRTWTAADDCGNATTVQQVVNVNDNIAPSISCPGNLTAQCSANEIPPYANWTAFLAAGGSASDNCQLNQGTFGLKSVSQVGNVVTRTYRIMDACGNESTCQQTITVLDNTPPTFLNCPTTVLMWGNDPNQCSAKVNWPALVAVDNCSVPTVVQTAGPLSGTVVPVGTYTVVYTATDAAGNTSTCTFTVMVVDTEKPTFDADILMPGDVTVECDAVPAPFILAAQMSGSQEVPANNSNAGGSVSGVLTGTSLNLTVAFKGLTTPATAAHIHTGALGVNGPVTVDLAPLGFPLGVTSGVFNTTINLTAAQVTALGTNGLYVNIHNATFPGGEIRGQLSLSTDVSDNCTPAPQLIINYNEVRTNGNCVNNYILTRTWRVTDQANNTTTHTQKLTVKDTKPPVAKCKDITVTLGLNGTVTITASQVNDGSTDNCSAAANLTLSVSPNTFNCSNLGSNNTVTLTVTDECGNSATCTAKVTVLEGMIACTPFWDIPNSIKCACKNNATNMDNGQFDELVQIKALAGQTWTLAAGSTGVFLTTSAAPPAAPTVMPAGTLMLNGLVDGYDNDGDGSTVDADEAVYYTLRFIHVEGQGYNANFVNNIGQTVNATSKCWYPTPYFTTLEGPYCLGTPPFVVDVKDAFGGTGTYTITINGVVAPGNIFNATTLGVGSHLVVATFNGGSAGMNDISDPGCNQSISKIVQVVTTPTAIACNDLVQVSLDEDCVVTILPDMVLEGGYACYDDYVVTITYPAGTTVFNPANRVNASHAGKTMKYTLLHVASGNTCWGDLLVEDKLAPVMACPANITIQCSQSTSTGTTGGVTITDCSTFTSDFSDVYTDFGQCANPRAQIIRTWTAIDKWGNSAQCSQKITIAGLDLAAVAFPPNVTLNCTAVGADPSLTDPSNTGRPTIGGTAIAAGSLCMASVSMTDEVFEICPNSYEILRTWKVRNMCLPLSASNPVTQTQIIKVSDAQGPVLFCPADTIISVNPLVCKATLNVPDIEFFEACSGILSFKAELSNGADINYSSITIPPGGNIWTDNQVAVFGNIGNLPIGFYTLTYTAEDYCANVSTCTVNITVIDGIPPVSVCQEYTQVAIGAGNVDNFTCPGETGPNGPLNDTPGDAIIPADAFNSGSYDACSPTVWFKVRRMDAGSCSNTSFGDNVRFCCSDIGKEWMVVFRVYDVDPGTGFIADDALEGHYSDCMVTVLVEDKLKPSCQAPANKTVNCDEYDPLNWYGNLVYFDNCGIKNIDTATTYVPNQITFEQCNYGQVRRTFTVFDCANNSSRCTQTITVNYKEQYRVFFPDDKNITVCNGATLLEQPAIFGENCELIGITHEDETFDVVPDACYKIIRTFRVINWCTYNPNLGDVEIPNSVTSTQGARVWIGENGLVDWANYNPNSPETPTVGPKTWNYPAPLTGTATNPEGTPAYVYKQVIKVQDVTPPQANIDPTLGNADYTFCDYSTNDPNQWNEDASYNPWGIDGTWSPVCQSHDLCEGVVDLSITATDDCSDDNLNFRYLLFLDLNGDGVMETTINSEAPIYGFGIREDEKTTIAGVKYLIGRVTRDFETDDPDHTKYAAFALPYGSHKIKWTVEDRCGNDFTKEYPIIVKDCKNPTVVCINGLSVNQMNIPAGAGMMPSVTLWATDFLQYAEDNCTDAADIDLALRDADINPGTGFPLDQNGNPQSSLSWDCSQIGTNVVELWARDKWGNADFCLTYLILSDNTGICNGNGVVAGIIKTKPQFDDPTTNPGGVADVNVTLDQANPVAGVPPLSIFPTSNNGEFILAGVPVVGDLEVTPTKDINPLNGVSTFDLVRMSKHVLNVQPFTTGYQYMAADINKNNQVTTFDIVELRKLILGIYTEFPANDSWRFIDKDYVFDMTSPLNNNLPEAVTATPATFDNHFVGVKVGDLTGDALANNLMTADDRTFGTTLIETTDRAVKAGDVFEMHFAAQELVKGGQFTLTFAGLEALEIVPGNGLQADNFALFADQSLLTASYNGDAKATFSVKFRAKSEGQLREMVKISSRVTKAEAYRQGDDQKLDIALAFRAGLGVQISEVGFELYQNQPNPFADRTSIGFHVPNDTEAALRVFDANGRMVHEQKGQFTKGYHNFFVNRKDIPVGASLLYYEVKTSDDSATKSMIIMH